MKGKGLFARLSGRPTNVVGQVSVTDIADEFYEDFATESSGRYWWWCRMILLDPNELIVDDGDDNLYRVPFTIGPTDESDGKPDITFGDPQPVKIEYVDIAARSEAIAAACGGIASVRGPERVAASYTSRTESGAHVKEGDKVRDKIEKLRAQLKLPASATDDEVLLAAATKLEADPNPGEAGPPAESPGTTEPEKTEGGDAPANPGGGDGGGDGGEVTHEPGAGAGGAAQARSVTVDAEALAALQADAKAGREAHNRQLAVDHTAIVDKAIKCGKIPSKARNNMLAEMKRDPKGTQEYLDELSENVIPVELRGNSENDGEGNTVTLTNGYHPDHDNWLATHMPDVARRKNLLLGGYHARVMSDGSKLPAGVKVEA